VKSVGETREISGGSVHNKQQIQEILDAIKIPGHKILLHQKGDGYLVQLAYADPDVETGKMQLQKTRKWYLSAHMTESEVVESVWAAYKRSMVHRASENFTYYGKRVYSQHFDVNARIQMCRDHAMDRRIDLRSEEQHAIDQEMLDELLGQANGVH
jgi:hypothetical protein